MAPHFELVTGPELLTQTGVGVVAPFDFALDRELWRWAPDDVSLFMTRLPFVPVPVTVEMASALADQDNVRRATRDLLAPEPLAVTFACASGSFVHGAQGERALCDSILAAGAPAATTTSGALIQALELLDVRRLAVVTPYIDSVTERLLTFLTEHGVEVISSVGLGLLSHIWKVGYSEVVAAVNAVDRPDADAVFISCTNVPTYDIIAPLERMLGKPVLTANQVTMCSALRAIGTEAMGADQWLVQMGRPTAA
ncbi:MAG TPA: Asp/Glu racemase [Pseudonocardiaceae bacterium]|jgi:maleate isomerase|nr:Asp/Glu racemase [Pseudonocardiaceae bacterium]